MENDRDDKLGCDRWVDLLRYFRDQPWWIWHGGGEGSLSLDGNGRRVGGAAVAGDARPLRRGQAAARIRSYSSRGTGTASGLPRSSRWTRLVSRPDHAATALMILMPKQIAPIVSGTLLDPGGATIVNTVGRKATMDRPMFWEMANPVTRVRVGNISWKKLA